MSRKEPKSQKPRLRQWDVRPVRFRGKPGWCLRRKALQAYLNPGPGPMVEIARVTGWRADVATPLLVDALERNGHRGATLAARRNPYLLTEEEGYRLALAFGLLNHTDSVRQAQRIVRAARSFEAEEAYLWYSYLVRAGQHRKEGQLAHALALLGEVVG